MANAAKSSHLEDVLIFIPSLNPDEKLLLTIRSLREEGFARIVVLDDGSREDTKPYFDRAVQEYGCELLRHPINLGKGRALKTAFMHILNTYPDCIGVVTVDAAGQHRAGAVTAVSYTHLGRRRYIVHPRHNRGSSKPARFSTHPAGAPLHRRRDPSRRTPPVRSPLHRTAAQRRDSSAGG